MSLRHEELTDEQRAHQAALDRSWTNAKRTLADPAFRSYLEESIVRANESPTTTTLSKDEFLASTQHLIQ